MYVTLCQDIFDLSCIFRDVGIRHRHRLDIYQRCTKMVNRFQVHWSPASNQPSDQSKSSLKLINLRIYLGKRNWQKFTFDLNELISV